MGENSKIPTFTPPTAPTFTPPPQPQHDGPVCYHHPTEPAVAQCARCGKYICKDCAEAYGVTSGEYAGRCLCYDCCQQLVSENVADLNAKPEKNQRSVYLADYWHGYWLYIWPRSWDFKR